jgi:hypothetical protein
MDGRAGTCHRCGREHGPVSLAEWSWAIRDGKKPPGAQGLVLWMLATRLDPATGCGWTTEDDLADLSQAGIRTVRAALRWAQDNLLLRRTVRGHHTGTGQSTGSHWVLLDPTGRKRPVGNQPTGRKRPVGNDPTGKKRQANRQKTTSQPAASAPLRETREERPEKKTLTRADARAHATDGGALLPTSVLAPGQPPGNPPRTARTLVAEWIDHCEHRPPQRTIAQIGKRAKELLEEGIAYEHVRAGLARWQDKGNLSPSLLPDLVHEVMNGTGRPGGRESGVNQVARVWAEDRGYGEPRDAWMADRS